MESPRAYFHVQRLLQHAATLGPELLQGEYQPLESFSVRLCHLSHDDCLLISVWRRRPVSG
ncbi:hypothetical protein ACTXGQ_14870 [Marinobacter sp. 1Y8]